jgi:hypothetical protein
MKVETRREKESRGEERGEERGGEQKSGYSKSKYIR